MLRESDSPRRELSDEVVAHVQDFQFLRFTQPVWQGLHMVPAGGGEGGDDDDKLWAVCNARYLTWIMIYWDTACV